MANINPSWHLLLNDIQLVQIKRFVFFRGEILKAFFFATSMHPRNATTQEGTTRYFKLAIISTISVLHVYSGNRYVNKISFPRFLCIKTFLCWMYQSQSLVVSTRPNHWLWESGPNRWLWESGPNRKLWESGP